jgi:hypothetical protein
MNAGLDLPQSKSLGCKSSSGSREIREINPLNSFPYHIARIFEKLEAGQTSSRYLRASVQDFAV